MNQSATAVNKDFAEATQEPVRIDTAVIPVAGWGTRLLPMTKVIPKHLQPVGDKSPIQHAVDEAREAGVTNFVFIINDNPLSRALLEELFLPQATLNEHLTEKGKEDKLAELEEIELRPGEKISFVVQTEQTGLYDAVKKARDKIVGPTFAVITPDDMILPSETGLPALARHHQRGGITVGVQTVAREDIPKFGILAISSEDGDGVCTVEGVDEKPSIDQARSDKAIFGRYIMDVSILDWEPEQPASVTHEVSLAHAINGVAHKMPVSAVPITGEKFDGGSKEGLAMANIRAYLLDPEIGPLVALALREQVQVLAPTPSRNRPNVVQVQVV